MTVCLLFDIYSYHYDIYTFFFNDTPTTEIYTLSLHDALPIYPIRLPIAVKISRRRSRRINQVITDDIEVRSEEHTLNSSHRTISYAVFCLKKKKKNTILYKLPSVL